MKEAHAETYVNTGAVESEGRKELGVAEVGVDVGCTGNQGDGGRSRCFEYRFHSPGKYTNTLAPIPNF